MNILVALAIALTFTATMGLLLFKDREPNDTTDWDSYLGTVTGINKVIGGIARPVSNTKTVVSFQGTRTYNSIKEKANLGQTFNSSVEIFISIQIASMLIGIVFLIIGFFGHFSFLIAAPFYILGMVLPIFPYNELISQARKRENIITSELPDFAELLLMVVSSMSIPAALSFTAERSTSLVGVEMQELVKVLTTRSLPEKEAFAITKLRLATPDAVQFLTILENGYVEGMRVAEQITNLAENMRRIDFQRKREYAKKLPVKLVIIFALHFIPLLMGLAFIPVIYGFLGLK